MCRFIRKYLATIGKTNPHFYPFFGLEKHISNTARNPLLLENDNYHNK